MTLLEKLQHHDHCGLDCFECDRYDGDKCGIGKSSKSRKEIFAEAVIEFVDIHGEDDEKSWSREWSYIEEAARWLRQQEGKA